MFADAIVYILAVVIEFLNAAVASFAMVAIPVHIQLAAITPDQQLLIPRTFLKKLIYHTRVYWID